MLGGFEATSDRESSKERGEDSAEEKAIEDDKAREERVDRREGEAPVEVRKADSVAVVVAVVGAPKGRPSLKTEGVLELMPSVAKALPLSMSCMGERGGIGRKEIGRYPVKDTIKHSMLEVITVVSYYK